MRRSPAAVLLTGCLLAAGCAGIPTSGSVHVGKSLSSTSNSDDVSLRYLPPAARSGLSPTSVVQGFLRAMVNSDGDYEIARTYLTDRAASAWDTGVGVTTYDDASLKVLETSSHAGTSTVQLRVPRVGFIDTRGEYSPAAGRLRAAFRLSREHGQWRIAQPPRGLLLSTSDTQRAFRLVTLYYLDRTRLRLVPEQVLLRPQASGLTSALVRVLLAGPGPWLSPAVSTAFPRGTELLGNVPVGPDGTAEVNVTTAVRQASSTQLRALSAQLVWTLRQVSEVEGVELLADGAPLAVPGVPAVQPRDSWQQMNPAPDVAASGYFAGPDGWRSIAGSTTPDLRNANGLTSLAMSTSARTLAALRVSHRATLMVWHSGARPVPRVTATTFTPPTFDPAGDTFSVASAGSRWIVEVTPTGDVHRVAAAPALLGRAVQSMELSPDGSRAAVVAGPRGHGRLLIGRVSSNRNGLRFDGFRDVLPSSPDVRGVAWESAEQLDVTVAATRRQREVVTVDVDGYSVRPVSTDGVRGAPVDVAIGPGQRLLLEAGGSIWQAGGTGRWGRVGKGTQPAYPS
jgi:hypothetical protein